jgi:hypothetical protein
MVTGALIHTHSYHGVRAAECHLCPRMWLGGWSVLGWHREAPPSLPATRDVYACMCVQVLFFVRALLFTNALQQQPARASLYATHTRAYLVRSEHHTRAHACTFSKGHAAANYYYFKPGCTGDGTRAC